MSAASARRIARAALRRPLVGRRVRRESPRTEMSATRVRTLNRRFDELGREFGDGPADPGATEMLMSFGRSGSVPVELLDDQCASVRSGNAEHVATLDAVAAQLDEVRAGIEALRTLTTSGGSPG